MKTSFDIYIKEKNEFIHKYKDQHVKARIKEDYYYIFRKAVKFHSRGMRYIDEMEKFFQEIQAYPFEYDDNLNYIIFKTHKGQENEVIKRLKESKYVDFAFQQDDRELESDELINIGEQIIELGEEYMELSDNEIKKRIDCYINSLIKIRDVI